MDKILYHPTPGTTGFFRARNVPKIPIEPKNFETVGGLKFELGGDFGYKKAISKYNEALKACKEEAIKNGEITNPDMLPVNIEPEGCSLQYRTGYLKPGDMFDVPEWITFEDVTYTCNHIKKQNELECQKSALEFPDCCGDKKTSIRLVCHYKCLDIESEEKLTLEMYLSLIGADKYNEPAITIWKTLKNHGFTIQRKIK